MEKGTREGLFFALRLGDKLHRDTHQLLRLDDVAVARNGNSGPTPNAPKVIAQIRRKPRKEIHPMRAGAR